MIDTVKEINISSILIHPFLLPVWGGNTYSIYQKYPYMQGTVLVYKHLLLLIWYTKE